MIGRDERDDILRVLHRERVQVDGCLISEERFAALIERIQPLAARVTQDWYDWRDRLVASKGGVQATEDTATHRPISAAVESSSVPSDRASSSSNRHSQA